MALIDRRTRTRPLHERHERHRSLVNSVDLSYARPVDRRQSASTKNDEWSVRDFMHSSVVYVASRMQYTLYPEMPLFT